MKAQQIVLILALVVIALTSLVFFKDEIFADPTPLSETERKAIQLLKLAQQSCLSGSTESAGVKLDFDSDLTQKLKLESGIASTKASGAVTYLNEQVRQVQDDKIRRCLEEQMPQIRACILGDCEQAALPKVVDFKFSNPQPQGTEDSGLFLPTVHFAIQNRVRQKILVLQDDGYFLDSIELFKKGESRLGQIAFQVRESHLASQQPVEFCLQRASQIDPQWPNYTQFECSLGKGCKHNPLSPKWFELCDIKSVAIAHSTSWSQQLISAVFPPAFAQGRDNAWAVPTLDTLTSRLGSEDLVGIGYTEFTLTSDAPLGIDADSYYFDLMVNGQPILIDGLSGDYSVQPYDPDKALDLKFALQNLNFSGVRDGCDQISLSMHFLKDQQLLDESIEWQRSYVSLRNAATKTLILNGVSISWEGNYIRAPREYDTEVFVNSILVSPTLDLLAHKDAINSTQKTIGQMKDKFDVAGLLFEDKPLVSVIRPPLSQISYGLAVGIVENTGQIRYTFANDFAKRLHAFLLEKRQEGEAFKKIIRHDSFLYSLRGDKSYSVSPPVCWDETT